MTAPNTAPTTAAKSAIITNLDASPIVRPSAGNGGLGVVKRLQATITPGATDAAGTFYRLVRIPSNSIVSKVSVAFDKAATTMTGDFGLWYSDSLTDGTSALNSGNLTAISSAFFAYELAVATFNYAPGTDPSNTIGLSSPVEITFAASNLALTDGNYLPSQSGYPIWQAVANLLALLTTPVGAFVSSSQAPHFQTASAGGSVYVRSDDPGGYFDICYNVITTNSAANKPFTTYVEIVSPF